MARIIKANLMRAQKGEEDYRERKGRAVEPFVTEYLSGHEQKIVRNMDSESHSDEVSDGNEGVAEQLFHQESNIDATHRRLNQLYQQKPAREIPIDTLPAEAKGNR